MYTKSFSLLLHKQFSINVLPNCKKKITAEIYEKSLIFRQYILILLSRGMIYCQVSIDILDKSKLYYIMRPAD